MRWKHDRYSGWGRALWAQGQLARPERLRHLVGIIEEEPGPALGSRRSYGDACLNSGGRAIDMSRLDRLLSFDPESGLVEAEAGLSLGALAAWSVPRGWLPPVMPGTAFATLGGALANDVHGKNHHGAGAFSAHVESLTLATAGGPRELTPSDTPELFRATAGGLGQTGVIARIRLRLSPFDGNAMAVTKRRVADWDAHLAALEGADAPYVVGWIDATARGVSLGRGIVEEAVPVTRRLPARRRARSVPIDAPGFTLSPPVVRLFNEGYYRRVPRRGRTVIRAIEAFFFPLDGLRDWNRLYGKQGFHQFQCVVPLSEAESLRVMLERIASVGLASPLAVLKRLGPGRGGHMSFPMEGYTLAVDFPNRRGVEDLVGSLARDAAAAGGRIYLAKDSLAEAGLVHEMYPERAEWAEIVADIDPDGANETDMTRRLNLRAH